MPPFLPRHTYAVRACNSVFVLFLFLSYLHSYTSRRNHHATIAAVSRQRFTVADLFDVQIYFSPDNLFLIITSRFRVADISSYVIVLSPQFAIFF